MVSRIRKLRAWWCPGDSSQLKVWDIKIIDSRDIYKWRCTIHMFATPNNMYQKTTLSVLVRSRCEPDIRFHALVKPQIFIHTANEGRWESNINVWFPFMYSQKWNHAASLFPKQNYNVLSPDSNTRMSVRDLYISRMGLSILLQPNMWTDPGNI